VLLNAFVGVLIGTERTLVPLLGEREFLLGSSTAVLSFVATFGVTKAFANLAAGRWAEAGRRRVLLTGWVAGLPVPLILMLAPPPHWWLILVANVLLGVNQGLCWSMTVVMKVDIAGEDRRGLAIGANEFAGYAAVALAAMATGFLAATYGTRPIPFLLGAVAAVAGILLTAVAIPETRHLLRPGAGASRGPVRGGLASFVHFTAREPGMPALNQAGLVTNFKDGVAWGLFPLLFAASLADAGAVGLLVGLYPLTWGVLQLATGPLSDRIGRKGLIVTGLAVQAASLFAIAALPTYAGWVAGMVGLGVGTAMVYPTLQAAVGDAVRPEDRAPALGTYRFWRDLGFAFGAVTAGAIVDILATGVSGIPVAVAVTGMVALVSGLTVAAALPSARKAWGFGGVRA